MICWRGCVVVCTRLAAGGSNTSHISNRALPGTGRIAEKIRGGPDTAGDLAAPVLEHLHTPLSFAHR